MQLSPYIYDQSSVMDDRDRMRQIVSSLDICKITWLLFNATHRDATTCRINIQSYPNDSSGRFWVVLMRCYSLSGILLRSTVELWPAWLPRQASKTQTEPVLCPYILLYPTPVWENSRRTYGTLRCALDLCDCHFEHRTSLGLSAQICFTI